jgi:hypothetical protein
MASKEETLPRRYKLLAQEFARNGKLFSFWRCDFQQQFSTPPRQGRSLNVVSGRGLVLLSASINYETVGYRQKNRFLL